MVAKKKKKGHGGLKFLAFLVVVGALIAGFSVGSKTEAGQRILGKREDRRLVNTQLTPRFAYAAAKLRVTVGSIYNNDGTMLDLTSTKDIALDRQSSTASRTVHITETGTEVSPGVTATPVNGVDAVYTDILTKDYRYESPQTDGEPWTRYVMQPYFYGTELDQHFIPMIDDIMGFELRSLPSKEVAAAAPAGFTRPRVNTPVAPSNSTKVYRYDLDMDTYRRVAPILAKRTRITAPPEAPVTLTIGFDDAGLLRFLDVSVDSSVATTFAQALGAGQAADYHYTFEVKTISGEPIDIGIPSPIVDGPADTTSLSGP